MRTDRTFACTDCRVRCWPVRRCPACGETRALVDLERAPRGLAELPAVPSGRADYAVGSGIAGTLSLVLAGAAGLEGMLALAELGVIVGAPLLVAAIVLRPRSAAKLARAPEAPELRYRALDSPIVRARATRVAEVGTVRARSTLTAPVSGRPCVAWRLAGEGLRGPLDDARGVPFTLVAADGDELEVDATIASIDIPVPDGEPTPLTQVGPDLGAWLRARGVDLDEGEVLVREAILEEGARVEVVGTSRRQTRADGYRGTTTRDVFVDLPGSPLIVRPPDPRSIA